LFGLLGISGVSATPFVGRFMDRLVPWYGSLFAVLLLLVMQGIYFGAAGINVAAVVIVAIGLDLGQQMQQVSQMASVYR
jgi:predicted MFS family arabinose efflux permease